MIKCTIQCNQIENFSEIQMQSCEIIKNVHLEKYLM